jgi:hypothetical protein
MKKIMMTAFVLVWSSSSFAAADYVGTWCNNTRYDDYIDVLQINDQDEVLSYGIGKGAHELSAIKKGYVVSRWASGFLLVINGEVQEITNYFVTKSVLSGKRLLILNNKLLYKDCRAKK